MRIRFSANFGKFAALQVRRKPSAGLQLRKATNPRFPFLRTPCQQRISKRTILLLGRQGVKCGRSLAEFCTSLGGGRTIQHKPTGGNLRPAADGGSHEVTRNGLAAASAFLLHPLANLPGDGLGVGAVVLPAGAAEHDVVGADRPFVAAVVLDQFAGDRRREDSEPDFATSTARLPAAARRRCEQGHADRPSCRSRRSTACSAIRR